MSNLLRSIQPYILNDLREKMVFLGGPRQVGKTTLAQSLIKPHEIKKSYFNWDDVEAKSLLMKNQFLSDQKIIILDEIHKYARWRNWLKGLYDTRKSEFQFLVTGSARLDHYRKGGDSLLGRYYYYRLHPLTLNELYKTPRRSDLEHLLKFGGFPEPFFKGTESFWRRWSRQRIERVVYQDIRDLENIKEISNIELLLEALPPRIGSVLSIASLARDLHVDFKTVDRWLLILENMYLTFRIKPFGARGVRAVKKEQKIYFWDWSQCAEEGSRFENLVASHLLKYCHYLEDREGYKMELRFLRDFDKREIDFVVIKDDKPLFAIECKSGEKTPSPHLNYFKERTDIPFFYQVHLGQKDYSPSAKIRVLPFEKLCTVLNLL